MKNMKRIQSVLVKRMIDYDPDVSYLEQEGFEGRLQQYRDGQFGFIGIQAEVGIGIRDNNDDYVYFTCQTISSGGLWSIESDSGVDYLAEVEAEELADLKHQLLVLGFSKRAISAAFKTIERQVA